MSLPNISNPLSTNIFETSTGVLNVAPTKISGQYKIVVCLDGKLYLDDYTGRRQIIDKSKKFLPQVSNFLKISNTLVDSNQLKYGGFQKSTKKYWHIPLYLGTELNQFPKYFILNNTANTTIETSDILYSKSKINQVIDLEKIGLHDIFNQLSIKEKYFNFPVYFNWEENNIRIYGYSIDNDTPAIHTFDMIDSQANQPYFDVINNKILNTFVKQNIFYPRFINLEFEFEYFDDSNFFNNFFGYLSYGKEIETSQIQPNKLNIKLQDFSDKIVWEQQFSNKTIILNTYLDIVGSGSIRQITDRQPQFRMKTSRLSIGDKISIYHPSGDLEFEYEISNLDIIPITNQTLLEVLDKVCSNATTKSNMDFLFSVTQISKTETCIIKIISNIYDKLIEDYTVSFPHYFTAIDKLSTNLNKFRGINPTDIWVPGQPNLLDDINDILIEDINYHIIEKFKFDDKTIIRLDKLASFNTLSECKIFHDEIEKLIELNPINFLNYNSKLTSTLPCDRNSYIENLIEKFGENSTITEFAQIQDEQNYQYIKENFVLNELEDTAELISETPNNSEFCLSMIFNSMGNTSFITPDTLNIDKQFYLQNGNLDISQLDSDILRYNWFLINGICPDYLKNDIRSLRYFEVEELPKLTSKLLKVSDDYCETVFLGVKYQLPTKYSNFQFATYLNFNDKNDSQINYNFIIDIQKKTLYLVINKYLDFVDLLRGGDDTAEPLLDLSFFYSVKNSFNTTSEYLGDFKSSVLSLCDEFKENDESIYFNEVEVRDWKYFNNGKWYIAIRNQFSTDNTKINDLRMLFDSTLVDNIFYVYSTITLEDGTVYNYPSMTINIKGITKVNESYLWCEDVLIKFFDTEKFLVQKYNEVTGLQDVFEVEKSNIINYQSPNTSDIFGYYEMTTTIVLDAINQQFKLLLPSNEISLKEQYFEINQNINGSLATKTVFTFPECIHNKTNNELIELFDAPLLEFDYSVYSSKINLFNRNQVWRVIQDLFKIDLKFKFLSQTMIKLLINKFMVTNLIDYIEVNSLPIKGTSDFIKFKIDDVDRNLVIWDIFNQKKLTLINRFRTAYLPYLPIIENEKDFQLDKYKKFNNIFNIYDKNFGGENISATGIWNEVQGNLISSLFTYNSDILITIPFSQDINYKDLLIEKWLDINKLIITDLNEIYIKKINANIEEYIYNSFTDYLLNTFFNFDSIINELGQKIEFEVDKQNKFLIHLKSNTQYSKFFENLTFIFKRK